MSANDSPNDSSVARPSLPIGVRIRWDGVRERHFLLYPEGALALNETAFAVLELCDGVRTVEDISVELGARYGADVRNDVRGLLQAIAAKGLLDNVD
jgi:pyrroloquinoline quinone biosynthesis protein D